MTTQYARKIVKLDFDHVEVPSRICRHDSIFDEYFGGFWFEKYLREPCPVPDCDGRLIEGWEYLDTIRDFEGEEDLVGQWWVYCPVCGYAKKLEEKER